MSHPMVSGLRYVLSVPNLLMALTALATLTFGMFVFEAERALTKLDQIEMQDTGQSISISLNSDHINSLQNEERRLAGIQESLDMLIASHESRISVIEYRDRIPSKN